MNIEIKINNIIMIRAQGQLPHTIQDQIPLDLTDPNLLVTTRVVMAVLIEAVETAQMAAKTQILLKALLSPMKDVMITTGRISFRIEEILAKKDRTQIGQMMVTKIKTDPAPRSEKAITITHRQTEKPLTTHNIHRLNRDIITKVITTMEDKDLAVMTPGLL